MKPFIISQCCVCLRVKFADGNYCKVPFDVIPGTLPSHGYCPECFDYVLNDRREIRRKRDGLNI